MNTNEILIICRTLELEGKTPSVALVKARMQGPKILPVIVSGIKQYQSMPAEAKTRLDEHASSDTSSKALKTPLADSDTQTLTEEVTQLKTETKALKAELSDVKAELKSIREELKVLHSFLKED